MIFDKHQIANIVREVRRHIAAYSAETLGFSVLTTEDAELLRSSGFDAGSLSKVPHIERAHTFGLLSEIMGDERAKSLKYPELLQFIKYGGFIPLTDAEKDAVEHVKRTAYTHVKSLGSRIENTVQQSIVATDRQLALQKNLEEGIKYRKGVAKILSDFGNQTEAWDKDLARIVETEYHNAFELGRAQAIEKQDGEDARVYKDVYPGACRHCIRLYLTNGIGSQPKIFKLSILRANGDNYGLKPPDWKPIVGSTHPFCRCTLGSIAYDREWNPETNSFTKLKKVAPKTKEARERAKITVTVGGKEFHV